jgi:hypothetical protein
VSYLHIEDFKSGLDTRKSQYTAPPGSLRLLKNGHITRGGEIEKRKSLVSFATLPAGLTFGLHAVQNALFTFGSVEAPLGMPGTITYQRLQHADFATALSRLLDSDNFNGKIYAITEYVDGAVYHFYNGARVTDWDTISNSIASNNAVAQALRDKIAASTSFTAGIAGAVVTITAPVAGTGFTYSSEAVNGGVVNDQTLVANQTQANVAAIAEVLAVGSFRITGGTSSPGVNRVLTVTVDGINILGAAVDWATSNSVTATNVANQINAFASSTEYTASAVGDKITITALAGTGTVPNGFVVNATVGGNVTVGNITAMAGGVAAVAAQTQIVQFTVGGTFEPGDQYRITLNDVDFIVRGGAAGTGRTALTFGDKIYSTTLSAVYFSGFAGSPPLPDPTQWDTTGSGFINISTQLGGSDTLTALGVYQDLLGIFSEQSAQIWSVDADPDLNQKIQVLPNIGTDAHRSVVSFGDIDLFLKSSFGIRSLRARQGTNLASAQDVGTPIDEDVVNYQLSVSEDTRTRSVGVIEPLSGRYWLAIGSRIYVFSHYPGSKVAAWSTYEAPGPVSDLVVSGSRVYARVDDTIYQYGGSNGTTYDSTQVEVELPFLDFGFPATTKTLHSMDIGCEGTWEVYLRPDPNNTLLEEPMGTITASTYGLQGGFPIDRTSTHFGLRFKSVGAAYARIGNIVLHYSGGDAG